MGFKDIIDTYLKYRGIHVITGEACADAFLPQLLMDMQLSLFDKYVAQMECSHSLRKLRNTWRELYLRFNKDFFMPFTPEQRDYIIEELMDGYREWIAPALDKAMKAAIDCKSSFPEYMQENLAALMLCCSLTNSAAGTWADIYRDRMDYAGGVISRSRPNQTLEALLKVIHRFDREYIMQMHGHDEYTTEEKIAAYYKAMKELQERLGNWPKLDEK